MADQFNSPNMCRNTRSRFTQMSPRVSPQGSIARMANGSRSAPQQALEPRTPPLSRASVISLLDSAVALVEEDFDDLFQRNDSSNQKGCRQ